MKTRETRFEVQVPWVLGLISTRSLTGEVTGILELVAVAEDRIELKKPEATQGTGSNAEARRVEVVLAGA